MTMDDRTVVRPMPGGRRARKQTTSEAVPTAPAPLSPPIGEPVAPTVPLNGVGCNPVLTLITPVLTLLGKMKSAQHPDLDEFHRYAVDQIRYYQSAGWGCEANQEASHYISYALCTLIDEVVQNTPWGLNSDWGSKSLLITFHEEAWGGQKFFQYLQQFIQRPANSLMLLELYYTFLALGFEGEYRNQNNGRSDLERLKDDVYVAITRQRDLGDIALSPAWEGVSDKAQGITSHIPYWVVWTAAAAILLAVFLGLNWDINRSSDELMSKLAEVGRQAEVEVAAANLARLYRPVRPVVQQDLVVKPVDYLSLLRGPLQPEIEEGIVEIIDEDKLTRLRLRHAKLFPSGRATVNDRFEPLVEKVGGLLADVSKPITVVGHSDNVPIYSGRFPSNWALSKARADAVQTLLMASLTPSTKVRSEGMADSEPLVPNNSAKNRALNRRVEILLRK